MRVLVTGGAGFIGSHMVRRLLDEGCEVLNVDKLTYAGSLDNLEEYATHAAHRFAQVDICNLKKIRDLFADFRPDAVLHMAAESHVDRSIDNPQAFIDTNVVGTHNMVKAAYDFWSALPEDAQQAFRFVHLSTDEVFGALKDGETPFDENSPYRPNSPYAASKASSDLLVRSYSKTYDFPAIVVNSSNNYGPRQYPEKLIPLMVLNALEEKALPVYGDGQQVRDWLFVGDHVEALWKVLNGGQAGETYCVGGECEVRNIDLVKTVCDILDQTHPRSAGGSYHELISFVTDRPGHDFRYAIDSKKLQSAMDWKPSESFQECLAQTVAWYAARRERLAGVHERERQGQLAGQIAGKVGAA